MTGVQTCALPIWHREYGRQVVARLKEAGLRAYQDERNEKVNFKIREAQVQKVPFMLVAGDREAQSGQVSVRNRKHGDQGARSVEQFIREALDLIRRKAPTE